MAEVDIVTRKLHDVDDDTLPCELIVTLEEDFAEAELTAMLVDELEALATDELLIETLVEDFAEVELMETLVDELVELATDELLTEMLVEDLADVELTLTLVAEWPELDADEMEMHVAPTAEHAF